MPTKRTPYTDEEHITNYGEFARLMNANEAIPDELYYWFHFSQRYIMELGETGYGNMYAYVINHNDKASQQAMEEAYGA